MLHRASLLAAPLLLAAVAGAQTPGFHLVGHAPGTTDSSVQGLSRDGTVAVGSSGGPNGSKGFRWTLAGGREDFGLEPGMPYSSPAWATDATGQTIVGRATLGKPFPLVDRAYRRIGNGSLQNLGLLPGQTESFALGVSGDGATVVGYADHLEGPFDGYGEAFRWTEPGGMQGLGYVRPGGTWSAARGISRDGTTIVGENQTGGVGGDTEAFIWTAAGGMRALPGLPGSGFNDWEQANAANADGSVVVGWADVPGAGSSHAARWVGAVLQDLGTLPGIPYSHAWSVSDNGQVIGGTAYGGGQRAATVWTPTAGMLDLGSFLALHGVTMPAGYQPEYVFSVSGDGQTLGGVALNLTTNRREGFVATIPSPGALAVLAPLAPPLMRRRRARIGARSDSN